MQSLTSQICPTCGTASTYWEGDPFVCLGGCAPVEPAYTFSDFMKELQSLPPRTKNDQDRAQVERVIRMYERLGDFVENIPESARRMALTT